MTRILATTDMSVQGQHGVRHAVALAEALGAQVTVLTVQPDPTPAIVGEFGYLPPVSAEETLRQESELRGGLAQDFPGLAVHVERSNGRSVWQTILDYAAAQGTDLLVMSTHGRTGLGRVLLGSVAEAVAQHATCPVLLVKGDQPLPNWKSGQHS